MQTEMNAGDSGITAADEDLIDTLIAISVISRRLAGKLKKEGDKQHEQNERTFRTTRRTDCLW